MATLSKAPLPYYNSLGCETEINTFTRSAGWKEVLLGVSKTGEESQGQGICIIYCMQTHRQRERCTLTQREREKHTSTERDAHSQRERERERERERDAHSQRERDAHSQRERERDAHVTGTAATTPS